MDNLSAHKMAGVQERIEEARATLLYLPPYSPDLNPIEKLGTSSKGSCNRTRLAPAAALDQTIAELLPTITAADAMAWFRLPFHALYVTLRQVVHFP